MFGDVTFFTRHYKEVQPNVKSDHHHSFIWLAAFVLLCSPFVCYGKQYPESLVLNRLFSYRASIDGTIEGYTTTAYLKTNIKTDRRNITLVCVPHLYPLARSQKRSHLGETYATITFHEDKPNEATIHATGSTIRRHRRIMPNIVGYLTPNIYRPTLISDHLFSPFHRNNKRFYRYKTSTQGDSLVRIDFKPRVHNTQMVKGHALLDPSTGRVFSCLLSGEYDMVSFVIEIKMGDEGIESLIPQECIVKAKASFFGNRLRNIYHALYGLPVPTPSQTQSQNAIDSLRAIPLTASEKQMYAEYDSIRLSRSDTTAVKEKNFLKDFVWDKIGDNLLNRIRGSFGTEDRGFYKLSPILNPLYLSYSKRRGVTYRFTANAGYVFGPKSDINFRAKLGYSFLQKQVYIDMPVTYTFDAANNGYFKFRWKGGDRITSSTVVDKLKFEHGDTIDWDHMDLDYFKTSRISLVAHYDLNQYVSIESGIAFNYWKSVHDKDFAYFDKPSHYDNSVFTEELTVRPLGWKGPIVTMNYERTLKGPSDDGLNYEKWEFDCSYIHYLPCLRALSLRGGGGFYSTHTNDALFLDFNNFRENNIPGGWNDDWSGEFELLHRNWYNSSRYYLRFNATYESPLLLMSWLPILGTIIETERIYLGYLSLSQLKNYMECGYSMTNRVVSMGVFTSFREWKFDGVGIRLGFELFDKW